MRTRAGYTLLELILALAIGLLLIAALYTSMDLQFRSMQTGRETVLGGQLARGLLGRVAGDVRLSLAYTPAKSNTGSTTTQSSTATTATTTATGSQSTASSTTTAGQYNSGVVGSESQIILSAVTVPRFSKTAAQEQVAASDLRRFGYELMPGAGLVRQTYRVVDVNSGTLETIGAPEILAHEVVDLQFRYYDSSTSQWLTTWDGTTSGPPQAVEITMAILPIPKAGVLTARPKPPTHFRTVAAIPTAVISQDVIDQAAGGTQ